MANAGIRKLPFETLVTIIQFVMGEAELEGRGSGQVRDLCVVSKQFRDATHCQWVRVPQRKKRENRRIVRAAPVQEDVLEGEGGDVQLPVVVKEWVMEDEVTLKGDRLKIGQVIVWRDLRHAQRCIALNRTNWDFWIEIRAIFLAVVTSSRSRDLRLAHLVFAGLYEIWVSLNEQKNKPKPKLQWLRLSCSVWAGLKDMDAPGMFYLSQLHGVPFVRFHPVPGKSISCFVSKKVRDVISSRTRRPWKPSWSPTGLENPSRTDWRQQALRKRRKNESANECYRRFLVQKYDSLYK